jgi:hypothetical protein
MTSFAVVTPSRGLVHSRTIEAVMSNVEDARRVFLGWFLSHDKPIPDCDEAVAEVGLATGADFLWFVEEDVIPPPGSLAASIMLMDRFDVVAVDYPVGAAQDAWGCLVRDRSGEILWCGLGATLVKREVFERLPRPWFSTKDVYVKSGTDWLPRPRTDQPERRYGGQDIAFCMELRQAGFRIGQVKGMTAEHARLESLGAQGTNHGCHTISIRTEILRQYPG